MILILWKINKRQRLLSNCHHVSLSKKYQLTENIRILTLFRGHSIITLFFGWTTNLFGIIRIVFEKPDLSNAIINMVKEYKILKFFNYYFQWFNLYIIILSIYWIRKSHILLKVITKYKKSQKIEPQKILDTFGGQIKINQTTEEHFEALKFACK